MEDDNNSKYAKLLGEYTKLRTHAKVLKNAFIEERNKVAAYEEQHRTQEQSLRRAESEIDSVTFRNKQLEHRVLSLLNQRKEIGSKSSRVSHNEQSPNDILSDELQQKIVENEQLKSIVNEKNHEIEMLLNRIKDLEMFKTKNIFEFAETEKRLRKELEILQNKTSELDSIANDGDSASLNFDSAVHNAFSLNNSQADRIELLEKELNFYKTEYELLKIAKNLQTDEESAGGEYLKRFEELFRKNCIAEAKANAIMAECDSLRTNVELLIELNDEKDKLLRNALASNTRLEEDFQTTKVNYEEQICVLTDQLLNLSSRLPLH